MRQPIRQQMTLEEVDISKIPLDTKSRDELPKVFRGLQYIYSNEDVRSKVFKILDSELISKDSNNGRPGMTLWEILCFGVSRLTLNTNYDRLHDLSNNHRTLRQMVGLGPYNEKYYSYQSIVDNVKLFTPDILDKVNQVVVEAGHSLLKKKDENQLEARVDSFVVESNVRYPVDYALLFQAIRKVFILLAPMLFKYNINGLMHFRSTLRNLKKAFRAAQKAKRSKAKNRYEKINQVFSLFLEDVKFQIKKVSSLLLELQVKKVTSKELKKIENILNLISKAETLSEQVERRILNDEAIKHDEKIFSIFEEYVEWICKGKAGVSQEIGLNVAIIEDQHGFILNHRIMKKEKDSDIAVKFVEDTKGIYENLNTCSFDKGFYSSSNKKNLDEILDEVILPKKGKRNEDEKREETTERYISLVKKHSRVESAINSLENHGLDRCPDRGIKGFETYISLAILSFNIHRLGDLLLRKEKQSKKISDAMKRAYKEKRKKAA